MSSFSNNLLSGLGRVPYWLFYLALFLIPLWALPYTISPVDLNKSYLAYFLVILAAVSYLGLSLRSGRVVIPKNLILILLAAFLASLTVSSFSSQSGHVSFLGLGFEPATLSAFLLYALAFVLASFFFSGENQVLRALVALFSSFTLLFLFQVLHIFGGAQLFSWIGSDPTANLFGSWNDFGIFSSFILLLSLILFDFLPRSGFKIFLGFVFLFSLVAVAVVNFALVWWLVAVLMIVFTAYLYSRQGERKTFIRLPFLTLLIALFFILVRPLASEFTNVLGIQFIEVRPTWSSTGQVVRSALGQNPAFGSGPNTFAYDWLKYRSPDISRTPFWQVRFSSGTGFLPSLIAGAGIVGAIFFLGFLLLFLWQGFKALVVDEGMMSPLLIATFLGALYLWIFAVLYSVGFVILFLAFLFTGMFLGLATSQGLSASVNVSLFQRSGVGFVSALALIFLIVVSISWFYVLTQKYYAAVVYGHSVQAVSAGNLDEAESKLARAIGLDGQDRYFRTATDLGLSRLAAIVNRKDLPPDQARTQFQNALGATIQNAQAAVNLNPSEPLNWVNLGRIYEAIVPFKVQGASDFAINAYAEALKRFPSNPELYLAQARVELTQNKLKAAKDFLLQAVAVKNDYAPAHFLLAQIEAQSGNSAEAIRRAETAVLLSPNDLGALFQLGLLYYQNRRYGDARVVLERSVALSPNYSNARYFLGLIYDQAGEREKALDEFQKILNLNPDNNEIRQIIQNLQSGNAALFKISPPNPAPEKRSEPPIPDQGGSEAARVKGGS
ncbi:MAG: tetratricopeptide repeat protein [bacterium]|nr:tetratricopeptide repeat protein [bacterium]